MNDFPIIEDLLLLSILLHVVDFLEGNIVGEITRQSQ